MAIKEQKISHETSENIVTDPKALLSIVTVVVSCSGILFVGIAPQ